MIDRIPEDKIYPIPEEMRKFAEQRLAKSSFDFSKLPSENHDPADNSTSMLGAVEYLLVPPDEKIKSGISPHLYQTLLNIADRYGRENPSGTPKQIAEFVREELLGNIRLMRGRPESAARFERDFELCLIAREVKTKFGVQFYTEDRRYVSAARVVSEVAGIHFETVKQACKLHGK